MSAITVGAMYAKPFARFLHCNCMSQYCVVLLSYKQNTPYKYMMHILACLLAYINKYYDHDKHTDIVNDMTSKLPVHYKHNKLIIE